MINVSTCENFWVSEVNWNTVFQQRKVLLSGLSLLSHIIIYISIFVIYRKMSNVLWSKDVQCINMVKNNDVTIYHL